MRYQFRFDLRDPFAPDLLTRLTIAGRTSAVLPDDATLEWHLEDDVPVGATIEFDLADRWTLEAVGVTVQAWNSALVYVAGWPTQSIASVPTGGALELPSAIGSVGLKSVAPVELVG